MKRKENEQCINDLDVIFRSRIEKIMTSEKLGITALSNKIGVPQSTLSNQLSGNSSVGISVLYRILDAFPSISAEWLMRGEGDMYITNIAKSTNSNDEPVPSKEVLLVPAGARGGSLDHFQHEVGLNAYNAEVISSPFINADLAMLVKNDSMAPDYPAGTYLFLKRLITNMIEWGQCYVVDTADGSKFYCLHPSKQREGHINCIPLNPSPRFAPFDMPKEQISAIYKVVGAMKW